jgi:uncharacterized protein (TIGR02147 family)
MQPVSEYIDYRKFLADYYEDRKANSHYFSYRYFSQKIEINSPSFLKYVIEGKRNLTMKMVDRFCKALDLSVREARYFRNLVLFNQAKTSGEKQDHYAVLRSMSGMVKEEVLGTDQYDYFSHWYTPVIRELICMRDFGDDYKSIAETLKPPILPSEARAAVTLLLRLKLVERQENGGYRQTESAVTADSLVVSLAVRSFTRKMLDLSKTAIDTVDRNQRHISGITMGISPEAYDVLAAELEAFKDRVKIIVNRDVSGSKIYQMNLSLFPVSEDVRSVSEKRGWRNAK